MKEVRFDEFAPKAIQQLPKGAFLTACHAGKQNTMTIGWGNIGVIWGIPIFTALIRPSRFTFGLVESSHEFTISIPLTDMSKALSLCGTKSGRDIDKFAAAGLQAVPSMKINTPVIGGAGLHYECKVVFKQPMQPAPLDKKLVETFYANGDFHTLFFGHIQASWLD